MCKEITKHPCGGPKATGRDTVCSNPAANGSKCQQFTLILAGDNCDACYFCKTEMAEEKGKVAEEVIAERNKEVKSEDEEETAREGNDKGERGARAEGGR
jgi:hypothetical protein